jgi:CRISPR/Cas system CMR subunit Cmr4 (Cas7 group RAMP superfamily)
MAPRPDRIQIEYTLEFQTPFHCGTGIRAGLIDRTIVRDSAGYLYVPGSTFKGVLRERCEQLARLYETRVDTMRELIASPHDEEIALLGLGNRTTMVTRIFGSHNSPGRLFFDDARQTDEAKKQFDSLDRHESDWKGKYKDLQTDVYTQVRLKRPTRTAVPGALYTSEFGVRSLTLQGSIRGWLKCTPTNLPVEHVPTYSLLLLLAGLHMVDRLGGNKSTGKGQCQCTITRVAIDNTPLNWSAWLDHLDALSSYSTYAAVQEEEDA